MANDATTPEHKEAPFGYTVPGRSTPPPTTSTISTRHEMTQTQPLVDSAAIHDKDAHEKDKEKDELDMSSPDANPGYKEKTGECQVLKKDDFGKEERGDSKIINGGDKIDGQLKLNSELSKTSQEEEDEAEDDSCAVNCLYYTMQCCECTIT